MAEGRKKPKWSCPFGTLRSARPVNLEHPEYSEAGCKCLLCGLRCQCHPDHVCAHDLLLLNSWAEFSKATCRCELQEELICCGLQQDLAAIRERGQLLSSQGRERRLVVAAAVGFEGRRRRRWEEEEGSCRSWDPALGSCRS